MTIKIAHMADTHLGYKQYGLNERENDFYKTFEKIIDDIISKDVDYVLHAGDLFEHPKPPIKALLVAQKGFEKLLENNIPIFVIAGNHDSIQRKNTSIPQELYKNENFHIINHKNYNFTLDEDIFLVGLEYFNRSYEGVEPFLKNTLDEAKKHRIKLLMLHGSVSKYFDFEPEFELKTIPEGYDYYAMGHLHGRINDKFKGGILSYPGSTEIRTKSEIPNYQKNGKGYNLVTIGDDNKIDVEFINIPLERKFIIKSIEYPKLDETLNKLSEKLESMDSSKKPVVYLTIKNGNFERSEVAQQIYDKLEEKVLTLRIKYEPTQIIENLPETIDKENITPENIIKEKIEDQFNEDVASLAVELYKNLSEKNIPEAQNVADKYYNKFYNNIGEEHDNK